jgi:hypothetical protein
MTWGRHGASDKPLIHMSDHSTQLIDSRPDVVPTCYVLFGPAVSLQGAYQSLGMPGLGEYRPYRDLKLTLGRPAALAAALVRCEMRFR